VIRGYALVLTLLVLAAALFTGWYGNTRAVYFPASLMNQELICPPGSDVDSVPVLSPFEVDWYSEELRSLEESSLYRPAAESASRHVETVRFTWIRSFHDPVVIRIDSYPDGATWLTAKRRAIGWVPGPTWERRLRRQLGPQEVERFASLLSSTRVLDQPAVDCRVGLDGARWIIEAASPRGDYTYKNRFSPESGPVHRVGLEMISLTGWKFDRVY
jgi:hypothetical protein